MRPVTGSLLGSSIAGSRMSSSGLCLGDFGHLVGRRAFVSQRRESRGAPVIG
jgi:hypothetical protein